MPRTRANGEGTIRKKTKGSYEGAFGYKDDYGKVKVKYFYAKTRKEVRAKIDDFKHKLKIGETPESKETNITVREWFVYFFVTFKLNAVEFSTINNYSNVFHTHIDPAIGAKLIRNVSRLDCQNIINSIDIADSTRTVELTRFVLTNGLETAVEFNFLKTNPAKYIKMPKRKSQESLALDNAQQATYIKILKGFDQYHQLLAYTPLAIGVGAGELTALNWKNISLQERYIEVNGTNKLGLVGMFVGTPKNKYRKGRVPINQTLYEMLSKVEDKTGYLFKSKFDGEPISTGYVSRFIKKIFVDMEIPDFSMYALRHTFATRCMEAGIPKTITKSWMRHANSRMLDRIYEHANDDYKNLQAKKLDDIF